MSVRIRHHTRRNQTVLVPLFHKPFPTFQHCHACHDTHLCKTLHLEVDGEGAVIVSKEIWEDLLRTPAHGGFRVESEVLNPPPQGITPQTVKAELDGVDLGGVLAHTGPRPQIFAHGATNPEAQPDERTVTVEEYVEIAERHGFTMETALNALLANILGIHKEATGADSR